jgi:hypothetical protein
MAKCVTAVKQQRHSKYAQSWMFSVQNSTFV